MFSINNFFVVDNTGIGIAESFRLSQQVDQICRTDTFESRPDKQEEEMVARPLEYLLACPSKKNCTRGELTAICPIQGEVALNMIASGDNVTIAKFSSIAQNRTKFVGEDGSQIYRIKTYHKSSAYRRLLLCIVVTMCVSLRCIRIAHY